MRHSRHWKRPAGESGGHYAIKSIVVIDFIDIGEIALAAPFQDGLETSLMSRCVNNLRDRSQAQKRALVCIDLQFAERKVFFFSGFSDFRAAGGMRRRGDGPLVY